MATRTCPQCGAQYVATVRRCIDCDVVLVDGARSDAGGDAGSSASPLGAGDQVGYELDGWGNQLKVTLEGMLVNAGISRVWEAGALVVSASDEAAVDDLIATVEGDDLPDLDDDVDRVALEIEGLDADGQALLDARLIAGSIAYAWDEQAALLVAEDDEEQVLAIIGEVFDEDEGGGGDEGLAAPEALSALYVAVDRLLKDPRDPKLAGTYVAAAGGLETLAVPYGFSHDDWTDLVAAAGVLADRVRPDAAEDDDAVDEPGPGPDKARRRRRSRRSRKQDGTDELAAAAASEDDEDEDVEGEDIEDDAAVGDAAEGDDDEDPGAEAADEVSPDDDGPLDRLEATREAAQVLRSRLVELV